MAQNNKTLSLAIFLSEKTIAAVQPDEIGDFQLVASRQASKLRDHKGVGLGLNPMGDFLYATILPVVYGALKGYFKDLMEAGIKHAAEFAICKVKPNKDSEKALISFDDGKLKIAVSRLRVNLLAKGLREDATDALIGILMQDIFLPT